MDSSGGGLSMNVNNSQIEDVTVIVKQPMMGDSNNSLLNNNNDMMMMTMGTKDRVLLSSTVVDTPPI